MVVDTKTVPRIPLSSTVDGNKGAISIPVIGLGTWQSKKGEATAAVQSAIDAGYRHIDCAFAYQNEHEIGDAIQTKLKDGTIKREDLFVTSKLWNTFHSAGLVRSAYLDSLQKLQLDSLDLYLIHWPHGFQEGGDMFPRTADGKGMYYSDVDYTETWRAMEALVDAGECKAIGLSNFNHEQIDRVLKIARIKPAMLQVEVNLYFQQKKLHKYCAEKGIPMTAYSPLGSPGTTTAGVGRSDAEQHQQPLDDPKVKQLAAKYGKSEAQILLRQLTQRGIVAIPKSVTPERIRSNIDIFNFQLTDEEMNDLAQLDKNNISTGGKN